MTATQIPAYPPAPVAADIDGRPSAPVGGIDGGQVSFPPHLPAVRNTAKAVA